MDGQVTQVRPPPALGQRQCCTSHHILPGGGAVLVEDVKVLHCEELAPVDAGLNGSKAPQHPHLLHVAHQRLDAQPLQFSVDSVEAAH